MIKTNRCKRIIDKIYVQHNPLNVIIKTEFLNAMSKISSRKQTFIGIFQAGVKIFF